MKVKRHSIKQAMIYARPVFAALAVCLIFSVLAWQIAKQQSRETGLKTAEFFTNNMDTRLQSIETHAYDLLNSYPVTKLSEEYSMLNGNPQSDMPVRVFDEIYQFCNSEKLVENILVYYPHSDKIISRYGIFTTRQYFLLECPEYGNDELAIEKRKKEVLGHRDGAIYYITNETTGNLECYYCRCVPSNTKIEECNCAVIVKIDTAIVHRLLKEGCQKLNMQDILMVTDDGQIYAQVGRLEENAALTEQRLEAFLKEKEANANESFLWNICVYTIPDKTQTDEFLHLLMLILGGGMLLATIFSMAIVIHNFKKREKHLRNIVNQLGGKDSETLDRAVENYLKKNNRESQEKLNIIEHQRALARYSFLKEILRCQNTDQYDLEYLCAIYGQNFDYNFYSVILRGQSGESENVSEESVFELIRDFSMTDGTIFWTRVDGVDVFLCNYDSKPNEDNLIQAFQKCAKKKLSGNFYGKATEYSNLDSAIREFRRTYFVIYGKEYTVNTEEVVIKKPAVHQQLLKAILTRNDYQYREACAKILMLPEDNIGISERYSLLFNLYKLPEMKEKKYLLDEMFRDIRMSTWERCLQFLELSQTEDSEQLELGNKCLTERIVQIIGEEYSNPQLSLSVISERLNISQSYLCRVFKKEYGESVAQFLNRVRIEHAKELLLNGDEPLSIIALRVGFLSDINLIRVFKKLENQTPGNFRNNAN